jgi:ATP-dependent Lon protease
LIKGTHKFSIPEVTQDYIIDNYCREPGVRSLKKYIGKICERIAFRIVESNNNDDIEVTPENLEQFIGTANY